MFNDFRFDLGIFTTHLTYICHKCLYHMENHITELPLHNANSIIVIFYVEKIFILKILEAFLSGLINFNNKNSKSNIILLMT